jgi:hypothetical protein
LAVTLDKFALQGLGGADGDLLLGTESVSSMAGGEIFPALN